MFRTESLPGSFGVRILNLDASQSLAADVVKPLVDALCEHCAIVIPGQSLTEEQFETFCSLFGRPHPHVIEQARMPGHPAILALTNVTRDGGEPPQGAAHWHTDQSYEEDPATATFLYSIRAPEIGGETEFADMFAAYDDLSPGMKARIEGLRVLHVYGRGVAARQDDYRPYPLQDRKQIEAVPMVEHPLARPHPVTGRKALYSPAGTGRGIVGMEHEEAAALLNELAAHALQEKYVYRHKYAVGEIVAWDTSSTMHRATPIGAATGPRDTRLLWRISLKGKPPIYS